MPFLEDIFSVILWLVVAVGVIIALAYAVYYGGIAVGILLVVTLFLGWIPIFACASDPRLDISFNGTMLEVWAAIATVEYVAVTGLIIFMLFTISDPDGLPPGLKFFGLFYEHPSEHYASSAKGVGSSTFDGAGFISSVEDDAESGRFKKRTDTHKMRKAAKGMEDEAARMRAAEQVARAAEALERAKARASALEKRKKDDG